jgi:hypothetical protein
MIPEIYLLRSQKVETDSSEIMIVKRGYHQVIRRCLLTALMMTTSLTEAFQSIPQIRYRPSESSACHQPSDMYSFNTPVLRCSTQQSPLRSIHASRAGCSFGCPLVSSRVRPRHFIAKNAGKSTDPAQDKNSEGRHDDQARASSARGSSGTATGAPNKLAKALVKVSYICCHPRDCSYRK